MAHFRTYLHGALWTCDAAEAFSHTGICGGDLSLAASVDSEEYYINMAVSWLFAEAVGKCPDLSIPYLESGMMKKEVHNKAIQKSMESRRVPDDTKSYLKTLKKT